MIDNATRYDRTIECPDCGAIIGAAGTDMDPYEHICPATMSPSEISLIRAYREFRGRPTNDTLMAAILSILPDAYFDSDYEGQIVIYTHRIDTGGDTLATYY